ncbi:hypothetical protein P7C70_g3235, partial [Phenoliferia sp. Uapishka_3]
MSCYYDPFSKIQITGCRKRRDKCEYPFDVNLTAVDPSSPVSQYEAQKSRIEMLENKLATFESRLATSVSSEGDSPPSKPSSLNAEAVQFDDFAAAILATVTGSLRPRHGNVKAGHNFAHLLSSQCDDQMLPQNLSHGSKLVLLLLNGEITRLRPGSIGELTPFSHLLPLRPEARGQPPNFESHPLSSRNHRTARAKSENTHAREPRRSSSDFYLHSVCTWCSMLVGGVLKALRDSSDSSSTIGGIKDTVCETLLEFAWKLKGSLSFLTLATNPSESEQERLVKTVMGLMYTLSTEDEPPMRCRILLESLAGLQFSATNTFSTMLQQEADAWVSVSLDLSPLVQPTSPLDALYDSPACLAEFSEKAHRLEYHLAPEAHVLDDLVATSASWTSALERRFGTLAAQTDKARYTSSLEQD